MSESPSVLLIELWSLFVVYLAGGVNIHLANNIACDSRQDPTVVYFASS